ncbi:MAG TPA: response regulator [Flavisolibacter sp.]|nr:response regulator [Flavisolibacter sp.]
MSQQVAIKNIYLADDNKADRLAFEKAMLQVQPAIRLTTVTNGDELMQVLAHYIPELLFLDLEMPHKNGLQCLQSIRSNKSFDLLPIIVFSATRRPNNIQLAYGLGANLFFSKPGSEEELASSLRQILLLDWNQPTLITSKYFRNNQYQPFQLDSL